ncbi:MAG: aldehyde dehydrogenase [Gammaproteobacteria bacterium]|nr:aldehyde dehydrogenase [Gammaproteobacteria bacterium]NNC98528.1 aldehyde dehydrogenase [Gammaproteobacteria bacterium]
MQVLKNYINGELLDPGSQQWLDNYNPATGQVYSQLPNSDSNDVHAAVQAARQAFPAWSRSSTEERSGYLFKLARLIEEHADELARLESIDNGKPLSLARSVDIPRAIKNFHFFAQAIAMFSSETHENIAQSAVNMVLREPLGVVACISPWNLPLYLLTWKIAPALITGNCVVAKPSEITPMTAYRLSELCIEAGLPKGVLNIVHGEGNTVGQALVEHRDIKAISFTGGTSTGADIATRAAGQFKKLSLELGGKNPNIIFPDCDYEKALDTAVNAAFKNQGQICLCGSRFFIADSMYDKFKYDFIERTRALTVGDPLDAKSDIGALVSREHLQKVYYYIKHADELGGKILFGGKRLHPKGHEDGNFLQPTIIEVNDNQCPLNQEEIFGPVVTLCRFASEAEAVALANDVRYGLSASIWTRDVNRALRVSKNLQAGTVWVNTWMLRDPRVPFGGVKASGVGREGGLEALRFFTEPKNVCIQY